MSQDAQKRLSANQLEAFYHSGFVTDQIAHFQVLVSSATGAERKDRGVILDVGGGVGHFAQGLGERLGVRVRVVDMDPVSVEKCQARGIEAAQGDAIEVTPRGDESVVCFNLMLHHLVGASLGATRALQIRALSRWRRAGLHVFVNEYVYESFVSGWSGALIFLITSSRLLSAVARSVSRVVPTLRANTFGVGVRFREEAEWMMLFREAGFEIGGHVTGVDERVDLPLRALLIRRIRRSSFLLVPTHA